MARKPPRRRRDYAAEYRRRAERAGGGKALYRKRVGDASGADLRRRRGHAGSADLVRETRPGDLVTVVGSSRDTQGRLLQLHLSRIDQDGKETDYWIDTRRMKQQDLDGLVDRMLAAGAIDDPAYPVAQFRSGSRARRRESGRKAA
jgi:hypothetical protein